VINLCTKFKASSFTGYKDGKGDQKFTNWDGLGKLFTQSHWTCMVYRSIDHVTYVRILLSFRHIAR